MSLPEPQPQVSATTIDFADLEQLWDRYGQTWEWANPFVTPPWLKAWWRVFGAGSEPLLVLLAEAGTPIGVVPLMVEGDTARFIGSADLCDSGDMVAAPNEERRVLAGLLGFLESRGIGRLTLEPVRPDSRVRRAIDSADRIGRWRCARAPHGRSVEMALPGTWDGYLDRLGAKQRHEVRRKLRRLGEAGAVEMTDLGGDTEAGLELFLDLFRRSRPDKRDFLTEGRESFFRALAGELAGAGMLRLTCLMLDGTPAAALFCVEQAGTMYLYNNGYDPTFRSVSIGVTSKVLSIRAAIEENLATYDFLGGTERYKYQLGGTDVALSTCVFTSAA